MNLISGLNWFDLAIIVALAAGIVIGYLQGLLRQVIGLAALYVATVLAAQYFTVVSGWIRAIFPLTPLRFANALGFFIILVFISSAISWLATDAYRMTKLRMFPLLDHFGGSVLGLISMVIIITVALPVLGFASGEALPAGEPTRILIFQGLQTSKLGPVFDLLKPTLLRALGPWLPGGLPAIFNL